MSQKVVYIRKPVTPIFDPDPDPDPIAFTTIAFVAIALAGATTTGLAITNPNFFTQLLVTLNPKIGDLAEEQLAQTKEFWRNIMIIAFIILCIVGLLVYYRYYSHKKEREKAVRRYRNARNRTMRMLRP